MDYIYQNMASFAGLFLAPRPPRRATTHTVESNIFRKRKQVQQNPGTAYIARDENLRGGIQNGLSAKDTSTRRRAKKLIKRSTVTSAEKKDIPTDRMEKTEFGVLEAIYQEIFERIEGRTTIMPKDRSVEWEKDVQAIEDVKDKFVEGFKLFTKLVVDSQLRADASAAFVVIKTAYWIGNQLREEHIKAFQQNFFDHPTELRKDLDAAILFSKLSQATSHETGRVLVRQWKRYGQTAQELGWKTLAILSFSASFRRHALVVDDPDWDRFFFHLRDLRVSIELAGDFFCVGWRGLLNMALGKSIAYLNLSKDDYHGHHHLWCITLHDGRATAAKPVDHYEVLEKSIYGADMQFQRDPRIIEDTFPNLEVFNTVEQCPCCIKVECECPSHIWFPCRVELIQTRNRGIGVRALQSIKKGQVLGEYIGELVGPGRVLYATDKYLLSGYERAYSTTAKVKGNWTRFVNHACQPNCRISHLPWRGKVLSVYKADKNIEMFEEITISYGGAYFGANGLKKCLCPEEVHVTDPNFTRHHNV